MVGAQASPVTDTDYYSIGRTHPIAAARYDEEGWQARSDAEPYLIPEPIAWGVDPFDDLNWVAQWHGWRPMDRFLNAYWFRGEHDGLRRIARWAVSWAAWRADAPPELHKKLGALTGMRATRLGLLLDAHFRGHLDLKEDDLAVLRALADDSAAHLQTPAGIQPMNHGYFQIMGLDLLARVLPDERWSEPSGRRAREALEVLVASQFTPEGVHVENSPVYHRYALRQLQRSGALERMVSADLRALCATAERVHPWYTFPDGGIADIGDSAGPGDPFTDTAGNEVDLDGTRYAVAPFWRSGYGIVRSLPDVPAEEASMLLVVATSHSHTHSHADKLSFELYEAGRRLIVDSGKYGYVRDPLRTYIAGSSAHNTVGIEGRPIQRTEVLLGGTRAFEPVVEDGAVVLTGEVQWARGDLQFVHRRKLTYRPGRSLLVRDDLSSESPQRYLSCLHFDRSLDVRPVDDGLTVDLEGGRSMRVMASGGAIRLQRGEEEPFAGWQSVGYMQCEPTTVASVVCSGQHRQIEWHIELLPGTD